MGDGDGDDLIRSDPLGLDWIAKFLIEKRLGWSGVVYETCLAYYLWGIKTWSLRDYGMGILHSCALGLARVHLDHTIPYHIIPSNKVIYVLFKVYRFDFDLHAWGRCSCSIRSLDDDDQALDAIGLLL